MFGAVFLLCLQTDVSDVWVTGMVLSLLGWGGLEQAGKGVTWEEWEGKEEIQTHELGEKYWRPGVSGKGKRCLEQSN